MLFDEIQNDLKNAMLSRNEIKVSTLRLLISELKNIIINKGVLRDDKLSDDDVVSIIQKEVKKRNESIISFKNGGREDLVSKEEAEMKILQSYLPQQLSDEELLKVVEQAINSTGATGISDMGKVIGIVMGQVKGRADGGRVSVIVKGKLGERC